jgi:hypothetical protein
VGLIAAALEEKGMRTVCLSTMEAIMGKVRPPRWLDIPFPLGFPLGLPHQAKVQTGILRRALHLLSEDGPGPLRSEYDPDEEHTQE